MAMNIRSITELPDYPLSTPLTADSSTALSTALKDAITEWEIDGGGLGSIGFQMLSCAKNSYIEVATQNKSYKLDLNKILDNINKTMAYVAWLQSSGITKEEAEELFVPYTGNMHAGGKAVTGLYIATPDTGTALKVDGPVSFQDQTGRNIAFSTNSASCFATYLSATNLSSKSISSTELTSISISGTNLTASNLTASGRLYAGQDGTSYNLLATNSAVKIIDLTATNLTAGNLCAGTNGSEYKLTANSSKMKIPNLTADNLSSAQLTAINLSAGGASNTSQYALQVSATADTINDQRYYIKAKELSATMLDTPIFQAQTIIATDTLRAGKKNDKDGAGYYVEASNKVNGLSATTVTTDSLHIKDLYVTEHLYAGYNGNEWNLTATGDYCKAQKLSATGLTASGGISELTAKAACWS